MTAVPPFRMHRNGALDILCYEAQGALLAVATRRGGVSFGRGDLNLSHGTGDLSEAVKGNLGILRHALDTLGAAPGVRIAGLRQRHTNFVHSIDGENLVHFLNRELEGDGMITSLEDVWLSISIGDCLPIMLFDPLRRVLAMIHAGWGGTAARIAEAALLQMSEHHGCRPPEMTAVLGPCIRTWRYQVDERVSDEFGRHWRQSGWREFLHDCRDGRGYLDLAAANRALLLETGMREEHIIDFGLCTGALPALFFSHRRDGLPGGRMLALASML
jgi:YfiH family protein